MDSENVAGVEAFINWLVEALSSLGPPSSDVSASLKLDVSRSFLYSSCTYKVMVHLQGQYQIKSSEKS